MFFIPLCIFRFSSGNALLPEELILTFLCIPLLLNCFNFRMSKKILILPLFLKDNTHWL